MIRASAMLAAVLLCSVSHAQSFVETPPYPAAKAIEGVERAFHHRQKALDPVTLERPSAPGSMAELFPTHGFSHPWATAHVQLAALDSERSQVCVTLPAGSAIEREHAMRLLGDLKLAPTTAGCAERQPLEALARSASDVLYGAKILDTQDVPAATVLSGFPLIQNVDSSKKILPAARLTAPPGQWSAPFIFTITNFAKPLPLTEEYREVVASVLDGNPPDGVVTGIAQVSVRSGFHVEHNCARLEPQTTCTVAVYYAGAAEEPFKVGALKIEFLTGARMQIGLLGVRRRR